MKDARADGPILVRCPDGRTLAYEIFGDPRGTPVLVLHGTPGSRLKFADFADHATEHGLCLVAVDRWGYGFSDAHPAPTLEAFAEDIGTLMTLAGIEKFAVCGISGGGPFAIGIAAFLPGRVTQLGLMAPVADVASADGGGKGMVLFHRFCFQILPHLPLAARATFWAYRAAINMAPDLAMHCVVLRAGSADRAIMREQAPRRSLVRAFRHGLGRGVDGPVTDLRVFSRPWPAFDEALNLPVRVWVGEADRNVPMGPINALERICRNFTLVTLVGQGHFWGVIDSSPMLEWFAGGGTTGAAVSSAAG